MVARLDEVAVADGELVPRGQVKTIQHLEGGIIADLVVSEGDSVLKGDPLVLLDLTSIGASVEAIQVQLDALELKRARLLAEASNTTPVYPSKVSIRRPTILVAEQRNYKIRQDQLKSSLAVAHEQFRQRQSQVDELAALLDGMRTSLKIADEHFELSVALLRDDLTPRMEHLKIQRDLEELRSAILQTESTLIRHRAALAEAEEKEREIVLDFQRLAAEDVAETEVQIASKQEILTAVQDQERRAEIRAPIDGFVQNMRHHTLGGVIQPGEPIMDLVPVDNNLLVEVRVDPRDIGHIEKGMKATVKFSTYDFMRYGGLEGEVINVAADANTDQHGRHYFRIFVETSEIALGAEQDLLLTPGMRATVDIHTGTKRVVDYLIGPVIRLRHEAFRER